MTVVQALSAHSSTEYDVAPLTSVQSSVGLGETNKPSAGLSCVGVPGGVQTVNVHAVDQALVSHALTAWACHQTTAPSVNSGVTIHALAVKPLCERITLVQALSLHTLTLYVLAPDTSLQSNVGDWERSDALFVGLIKLGTPGD
jgi:hypothetical protein